ncbi:unnamed protein product, partial [Timema podura]|nr:unnamed protein product [Timema podura]
RWPPRLATCLGHSLPNLLRGLAPRPRASLDLTRSLTRASACSTRTKPLLVWQRVPVSRLARTLRLIRAASLGRSRQEPLDLVSQHLAPTPPLVLVPPVLRCSTSHSSSLPQGSPSTRRAPPTPAW